MKKLLCITAHPDDDTLFSGILLKLKDSGWGLYEAILTGGENGVLIKSEISNLKEARKSEFEKFADLVGIEEVCWLGARDGYLKESQKILRKLIEFIRKVKPNVIIVLNPEDYHKDHRAAYNIGILAVELANRNSYLDLGKKIDLPLILISDGLNLLPNPDLMIDVSRYHRKKIRIMKQSYGSQMGTDSLQFSEGLARVRGARIKAKYAEAFNLGKISSKPTITFENIESLNDLVGEMS